MSSSTRLLWDTLRPSLKLIGKGSRRFLHGQTSSDFNNVDFGVPIRTCWLNAIGRVRALLEIRLEELNAEVLVLAGDINAVAEGFEQVIFPADQLKLERSSFIRRLQLIAPSVDGNSFDVTWLLESEPLPEHLASIKSATDSQVEDWRLKRGLPLGPGELNGENNPFELGLADWISLEKGCYLGQETLAKLANKGVVKQQLRFWSSDSFISPGEQLINPSVKKNSGFITSAMRNPLSSGSFGLAMVNRQSLRCSQLFTKKDLRRLSISLPKGFVEPTGDF